MVTIGGSPHHRGLTHILTVHPCQNIAAAVTSLQPLQVPCLVFWWSLVTTACSVTGDTCVAAASASCAVAAAAVAAAATAAVAAVVVVVAAAAAVLVCPFKAVLARYGGAVWAVARAGQCDPGSVITRTPETRTRGQPIIG